MCVCVCVADPGLESSEEPARDLTAAPHGQAAEARQVGHLDSDGYAAEVQVHLGSGEFWVRDDREGRQRGGEGDWRGFLLALCSPGVAAPPAL